MISEDMNQMKQMGKGDEAMEQSIAYVQEFLKENGTTWQDRLNYEKNKGRDEGRDENRIETARNLLQMNLSIEDIAKATGLSKIEIEALK